MTAEPAVVELRSVTHIYATGRAALSNIDLEVREGERVGLIGPSGAGKSTLLRTLNGLVIPTSGNLRVLGRDVHTLPESGLRDLRREVGMIFQEFALVERLSTLTNVLVGRLGSVATLPSLVRLFPSRDSQLARNALLDVGLEGYEERLVRHLSGGQKQRVGIARALVQQPRLILGDEPTANLDVRTAEETLSLLVALAEGRGATMVLSLHDVRAARRHCTRIVALRDGTVAWDGPAAGFTESDLEKVFY